MALIGDGSYEAIRKSLSLDITEDMLPFAVIALPIFQGAAEAEVVRRDPLAATRTGVDGQHIINAVVFLTASLIAPALPSITAEAVGDLRLQRKGVDWLAVAARLRALADDELEQVLDLEDVADRPTFFSLASGRRGQ